MEDAGLVDDHAVAAGGYADIHKGRVKDQNVCLKVIRIYEASKIDHVTKVTSLFDMAIDLSLG